MDGEASASFLSNLVSWPEIISFVGASLVAVLCGIIIGLERESKGKPAGLRTLVLICLGSALFVRVSLILAAERGDPSRVAAQIVSGIGFLGAGAILQNSEQGFIAGLTTAATIWVSAAIGMIVGAGHFVIAVVAVSIVVFALRLLASLEGYLFYGARLEIKKISFESDSGKTRWAIVGLLEENLIRPDEYSFHHLDSPRPFIEFRYAQRDRNHRSVLSDLACLPQVIEIN